MKCNTSREGENIIFRSEGEINIIFYQNIDLCPPMLHSPLLLSSAFASCPSTPLIHPFSTLLSSTNSSLLHLPQLQSFTHAVPSSSPLIRPCSIFPLLFTFFPYYSHFSPTIRIFPPTILIFPCHINSTPLINPHHTILCSSHLHGQQSHLI